VKQLGVDLPAQALLERLTVLPAVASRRPDREGFGSGELVLVRWLCCYAVQNRRCDTAATWLGADASGVVVGYASVAMSGVDRFGGPTPLAKGVPGSVPALLLGRLAVERRCASLGIGTSIAVRVLAARSS
jgi:hypothetical protein